MNKFESLEKAMCKELEALDQKVKSGSEMTIQDLDKAEKLTHTLKNLRIYVEKSEEMHGYESADADGGMSGYPRHIVNGRRNAMSNQSYADGYTRGYEEGRRQEMFNSYGPGRY